MDHTDTILQINPSLALCWDSETTVRVGFERAHARIPAASPAAQHALSALIAGVPEDEATAWNNDPPELADRTAVLEAAQPVLIRVRGSAHHPNTAPNSSAAAKLPPQTSIRTLISDDGRSLNELHAALETNQLCYIGADGTAPELAVQIIRFVEPLERTRRWLGQHVPHLLIRFTDECVRIGPVIAPRGSPCHTCEAFALVDADPALPTLAAQLVGRVPSSETPTTAALAGAVAAHMIRRWLRGEQWVHYAQFTLPVSRGIPSAIPTLTRIRVHPECACSMLRNAPQPPQ